MSRQVTVAALGAIAILVGTLVGSAGAVATSAGGTGRGSSPEAFDRESACDSTAPPQTASAAHVTGDDIIQFDVHVLLDRVAKARGKAVFETVRNIYSELDVDLRYRFERVDLDAGEAPGTQRLIDLSRQHVGGAVPAGADAVYTLSARDFEGAGVGQASCVGGIEFPDEAFAVGRDYGRDETKDGELAAGLSTLHQGSARVAAHEIGHLLGAHHHYATCTEPEGLTEGHPTPCSLMTPHLRLGNTHFGPLEGAVVRGYAERHLTD